LIVTFTEPVKALGGEPGRICLEDRSDAEKLVNLLLGGDVHEGALCGTELDPAVGLQTLQGFSHRLPADAEVLRELVLDQVLAPFQGSVHDQFHDRFVDGLAQGGGTLHPSRGSVGQHVRRSRGPTTRTLGGKCHRALLNQLLPSGYKDTAFRMQ